MNNLPPVVEARERSTERIEREGGGIDDMTGKVGNA
jgi:hypothetical protein